MEPLVCSCGNPTPCGRASEECCGYFILPGHFELNKVSSSEEISRGSNNDIISSLLVDERRWENLERFRYNRIVGSCESECACQTVSRSQLKKITEAK